MDAAATTTIELAVKQGPQEHRVALPDDTSTVASLKQQLEPLTGLMARQQKLIFKGKVLDDHQTLASYKLTSGSKVMLMAAQVRVMR